MPKPRAKPKSLPERVERALGYGCDTPLALLPALSAPIAHRIRTMKGLSFANFLTMGGLAGYGSNKYDELRCLLRVLEPNPLWLGWRVDPGFCVPPISWLPHCKKAWRHPTPPTPLAVAHYMLSGHQPPALRPLPDTASPVVRLGHSLLHYYLLGFHPRLLVSHLAFHRGPMAVAGLDALMAHALGWLLKEDINLSIWAYPVDYAPIITDSRRLLYIQALAALLPANFTSGWNRGRALEQAHEVWRTDPYIRAVRDGAGARLARPHAEPPPGRRCGHVYASVSDRISSRTDRLNTLAANRPLPYPGRGYHDPAVWTPTNRTVRLHPSWWADMGWLVGRERYTTEPLATRAATLKAKHEGKWEEIRTAKLLAYDPENHPWEGGEDDPMIHPDPWEPE